MQWTSTYYMLFICLGLSIGLLGPTLPSLAEQTQTQVGQLGAVFTASAFGALLGTLLGGRLFDRVRGHPALGIAQLISAACLLLYPLLPSVWLLFIVVFGKGVTDGFINTGANTLLIWTHKEKSSPYMNALHFFFGLGAFLAPFFVAQLLTISGGYRWAYWVLAVVGGLAGLRLLTLKGNPQHTQTASITEGSTRINYPLVIAAMLFLFFYVGAEIAFSGWIYTYAFTLNLANTTTAAYLTSGFWLTFTIGRLISIPLATRYKPQQLIAAALAGCLSILIVALIIPMSSTLVWILALVLGLCMAPLWPSGFTLAGQSLQLTSRVSGIILLGDSLGFMILPWLAGQVLDSIGPQTLIYLVFASLFFNLIAFVAILRLRHTAPDRTVAANPVSEELT
jgi:MFS transporter, FHS family, Na+ dependent glucose transporter 1